MSLKVAYRMHALTAIGRNVNTWIMFQWVVMIPWVNIVGAQCNRTHAERWDIFI